MGFDHIAIGIFKEFRLSISIGDLDQISFPGTHAHRKNPHSLFLGTASGIQGITFFIFFTHDRADPRTLELFADQVMPAFA